MSVFLTRTSREAGWRGALLIAASLVVFSFVLSAAPIQWPLDDVVEYWAAGRLNAAGHNPYDHAAMLREGIQRVKGKVRYTWVLFQLLPPVFTMSELRAGYAALRRRLGYIDDPLAASARIAASTGQRPTEADHPIGLVSVAGAHGAHPARPHATAVGTHSGRLLAAKRRASRR